MQPYLWLAFLLVVPVKAMWPSSWLVGQTCYGAAAFNFDSCVVEDYACLCRDRNYLATVALCIMEHSNKGSAERDGAWDHFTGSVCNLHDPVMSDRIYGSIESYLDDSKIGKAPADSGGSHEGWGAPVANFSQPIRVDEHTYQTTYRATQNYLYQKDVSVWQGSFLVGWWIFVISACAAVRLWMYLNCRFGSSEIALGRPSQMAIWWQKYISIPACFGFRHMLKLQFFHVHMMVPLRAEVIIIGVYFCLNIIFLCTHYDYVPEDPLFPTKWKAMMRYASDRSGIIGVIQLPLLTLFSLRNNPLIWLTGWSFAEYNVYHRAVARIAYMQFIIHGVMKHMFAASYGGDMHKYFYAVPYYRWGVAAMFLMAIMIATGAVRNRLYDIFLRLHVLCAIGGYVCVLYHLRGLGYKQTVYVSFALWAGDWLIRIGRIVFLNFALLFGPPNGKMQSYAQMSVINSDVVNIKIKTTVAWKPRPGQYVFIHVNRTRFWEAHPFSVIGPSKSEESFQLVCKARGGMTKRFCKYLQETGHDEKHPLERAVIVEGPYGIHNPVERYNDVLVIAGGVGVTGALPYVEYLLERKEIHPRVWFIWVVQQKEDCRWIQDKVDAVALKGHLRMDIYANEKKPGLLPPPSHFGRRHSVRVDPSAVSVIASPSEDAPPTPQIEKVSFHDGFMASANSSDDDMVSGSMGTAPWHTAHLRLGRPNIPHIMQEFFSTAKGGACVLGCGPPGMMDALRQNVCRYLELNENGRVDYFEEAYTW